MPLFRSMAVALAMLPLPSLGQSLTDLHVFIPADGASPSQITLASDGYYYGITQSAGPESKSGVCDGSFTNGCGTLYKMDALGNFGLLAAFTGPNGATPVSVPIVKGNVIYGTTSTEGPGSGGSGGTVYALNTDGTHFKTIYAFDSNPSVSQPLGNIAVSKSNVIYGTTFFGGLYSLTTAGALNLIASLPQGQGVVQDAATGNIFAATSETKNTGNSCGAVYEYQPAKNVFSQIFSFSGSNGCHPQIVAAKSGTLVGYTKQNLNHQQYVQSTIFELSQSGGAYSLKTLWTSSATGTNIVSGLTPAADGSLVGVTTVPGSIFSFAKGVFTTLYTFDEPSLGSQPTGNPIQLPTGAIVGSTSIGGNANLCPGSPPAGCGTTFSFQPATSSGER